MFSHFFHGIILKILLNNQRWDSSSRLKQALEIIISGDDIKEYEIWWMKERPNTHPTPSTLKECLVNIDVYGFEIMVQKMYQLHHVQQQLLYNDPNILKIFFLVLVCYISFTRLNFLVLMLDTVVAGAGSHARILAKTVVPQNCKITCY